MRQGWRDAAVADGSRAFCGMDLMGLPYIKRWHKVMIELKEKVAICHWSFDREKNSVTIAHIDPAKMDRVSQYDAWIEKEWVVVLYGTFWDLLRGGLIKRSRVKHLP
jgi:hypothetical protein